VKRRVPKVVGFREVHQARIYGSQEEFTAVMYQGSNFEKASYILVLVRCPQTIPAAPGSCGTA
jgi:hypothetical protein